MRVRTSGLGLEAGQNEFDLSATKVARSVGIPCVWHQSRIRPCSVAEVEITPCRPPRARKAAVI